MELKILSAIKKYNALSPTRLHMPGHKGDRKFCKLFKGANLDVTELSFIDNEKVVRSAEKDIEKILDSQRSWFLTNGSSSGVLSMVYAVKDKGKKLIIGRSSHKSVYNALELMGIEPIIIDDRSYGEEFYLAIEKGIDKDTVGALLTYPDYYGNTFDIKRVSEILRSKGKLLLIDNAHGGHFKFFSDLVYAGDYADIWVDGLHKTFPTLNQGAVLSTSNPTLIDGLDDGVNKFLTTSPSYPLLSSIEYGIKFYAENKPLLQNTKNNIKAIKEYARSLGLRVEDLADPFKLYIEFFDTERAGKILEDNNIFFEMNDKRGILFMFTPLSSKRDYKRIIKSLKDIALGEEIKPHENDLCLLPPRVMSYLDAIKSDSEWVDLSSAENRIAGANAGNFPPCRPLVVAGELITKQVIEAIDQTSCFGVKDGKVLVVKEDK